MWHRSSMGLFGKKANEPKPQSPNSDQLPPNPFHPSGRRYTDILYDDLRADIEAGYRWLGPNYESTLPEILNAAWSLVHVAWQTQDEKLILLLKRISLSYRWNEGGADRLSDKETARVLAENTGAVIEYRQLFINGGDPESAGDLATLAPPVLDILRAGPRFESVMREVQKSAKKYR